MFVIDQEGKTTENRIVAISTDTNVPVVQTSSLSIAILATALDILEINSSSSQIIDLSIVSTYPAIYLDMGRLRAHYTNPNDPSFR